MIIMKLAVIFLLFISGMNPQPRARSTTEEDLAGIAAKLRCKNDSPVTSNELEWDNDFVSADALESEQLIRRKKSEDLDADRWSS